MHLSILSKDCPWWGRYFFFSFLTKSIQHTKPTLSLSLSCILTLRVAGPGFGAPVLMCMHTEFWGEQFICSEEMRELWLPPCGWDATLQNYLKDLIGEMWGDGTFSMYSIFPSAGHRAGDGQDMISWSVNMINWDLLENFWNMIEAAELLFLLYFNNQQWEESWTHETWNGGLDFWWKSVKLQKRIHWSQT